MVRFPPQETDDDDEDIIVQFHADSLIGIQFYTMQLQSVHAILADENGEDSASEMPAGDEASTGTNRQRGRSRDAKKTEETAFFVCGHEGFDTSLNCHHRPPLDRASAHDCQWKAR
jgi:hypothetical protein